MTAPAFDPGRRAGFTALERLANGERLRAVREPITTGFGQLDRILGGGLLPGEVTVVGGDTGVNKSALMEQIALAAARFVPVTYFALEMGDERTEERILAKIMHVDYKTVQHLMQHKPDAELLVRGLQELVDEYALTIEQRQPDEEYGFAHLAAIAKANAARLVIIDDLQSLDGWNDGGRNAHAGNVAIVKQLVTLSKALPAHILIPHQLVKGWRRQPKQRPRKHDLADAAQLARMADAVILIHRPFFAEDPDLDRIAELIVDKNRNGVVCITHVQRVGSQFGFREFTSDEEAELPCCAPPKRGAGR